MGGETGGWVARGYHQYSDDFGLNFLAVAGSGTD